MGSCKSGCLNYPIDPHRNLSQHESHLAEKRLNNSFATNKQVQELKKYIPHFDASQCDAWGDVLACIKLQLNEHGSDSSVIGRDVMVWILGRFEKFHLTLSEKLNFITAIDQLIELSYSQKSDMHSIKICFQVGLRLKNLESEIGQKHKSSLEHFKFLTGQHHEKKHYQLQRFSQLEFTMSGNQIQNLAGIVRTFCQQDIEAFALLTLYFRISLQRNIWMGVVDLENMYIKGLKILEEEYSGVDVGGGLGDLVDGRFENLVDARVSEVALTEGGQESIVFESLQIDKLQQAIQFIDKRHQKSNQNKKSLDSFIKQLNNQQHSSQFNLQLPLNCSTTVEQLSQMIIDPEFTQSMLDWRKCMAKQSICKCWGQQSFTLDRIDLLVEEETAYMKERILEYFQTKTVIKIKNVSSIKAYSNFSRLSCLSLALDKCIQLCNQHQYPILKLTNRLSLLQKDLVLLVNFPHSTVEFRLILKQESISNQFYSKIKQLTEPKFYSPISNLIVLNQAWSGNFFTELCLKLQALSHHTRRNSAAHNSLRTSHDFGFIEMMPTFEEFAKISLHPYAVLTSYSCSRKIHKMLLVVDKIKQTQSISQIKPSAKHTSNPIQIKTAHRSVSQRLNQIALLFQMGQVNRAFELAKKIKTVQIETNQQGLELLGDVLKQKHFLQQALGHYDKSLRLCQKYHLIQSQNFVNLLEKLASLHCLLKNPQESIRIYSQSLAIRQQLFNQNPSIDSSLPLIEIGRIYLTQEQYTKADQYFNQALQIRRHSHSQMSLEYAQVLDCLGKAYQESKYHDKASEYNQKCLSGYQLHHGRESMICADIINRLGASHLFRANYEQALKSYKESLKIRQRVKGKDTIDSVPSLSSIGSVYMKWSEYKSALLYFKRSLLIVERTYGKNSIECVRQLNYIIVVFYHMERFQEAVGLGLRCLEIQETARGRDALDCSGTLFGLSLGYEKMWMGNEARAACQKAYEIRFKELGIEHQLTVEAKQRLQDLQNASVSILC